MRGTRLIICLMFFICLMFIVTGCGNKKVDITSDNNSGETEITDVEKTSQTTQEENNETEENPKDNAEITINLSVPDGWEPVEGSVILAQYMKNTASFMIKIESSLNGSVDDIIEQVMSIFENTFDNVKYEGDIETTAVGGNDARSITFTCEVSGMEMKYKYLYTVLEEKTYVITFGDCKDTYDQLQNDYDMILESIEFDIP